MTSEWRRVVGLAEETCGCGATIEDRIGQACPWCDQFRCPYMDGPHTDPCGATFDTLAGMKRHHSHVHDRQFKTYRDCEECGQSYEVTYDDQRFCSHACANASQRKTETRHCKHCDEPFEARPCDDERYCSRDCGYAERRTRETKICPQCGDTFEAVPSREQTYCSRACCNKHGAAGPDKRECAFCGDTFETYDDQRYCSYLCSAESRADRPEDLTDRLHELFVEEGRSVAATSRRVPELGTERIRTRLTEEGWYEKGTSLARQMRREDVTSVEDIDFSEYKKSRG